MRLALGGMYYGHSELSDRGRGPERVIQHNFEDILRSLSILHLRESPSCKFHLIPQSDLDTASNRAIKAGPGIRQMEDTSTRAKVTKKEMEESSRPSGGRKSMNSGGMALRGWQGGQFV